MSNENSKGSIISTIIVGFISSVIGGAVTTAGTYFINANSDTLHLKQAARHIESGARDISTNLFLTSSLLKKEKNDDSPALIAVFKFDEKPNDIFPSSEIEQFSVNTQRDIDNLKNRLSVLEQQENVHSDAVVRGFIQLDNKMNDYPDFSTDIIQTRNAANRVIEDINQEGLGSGLSVPR